ncbi:protein dpy-30 homolog [Drosophila innubila]|uniref:protein dpy-30 homolog n=1 Tax=Drosophila innubila TaxID=198719 RepID=UPI00148CDB48|nr:protein dpy-30 homolog [Drosophila innubila]
MSFTNADEHVRENPKSSLKMPSTAHSTPETIGDAPRSLAACHKPRPDTNSMTVRQYLDLTVAPILLHGLQAVARERPTDPVSYLATYLLKNKNRCDEINTEAL